MAEADLFASAIAPDPSGSRPLADRMRPRHLDEVEGQEGLLGPDRPLRRALDAGNAHSMILWGPPGTGKTTLGRLVATLCKAQFLTLSAVLSGVKDIRQSVDRAHMHRRTSGGGTVLFVDEVHRFNKAQQDAFLPHVEDGTLVFIGATTENPSFEVNSALLSRARVYVLKALDRDAIRRIVDRAISDTQRGLGATGVGVDEAARDLIADAADGDARQGLSLLELAVTLAQSELAVSPQVDKAMAARVIREGGARRFDKGGDSFYDQISALHKSIRGSDPDAALYWLARMLDGGCDPLYLARRLVRIASEDIGNADPRALRISLDAYETYERLGSPEGELAIAQAAVYMACAAKSNAVYRAFDAAMEDVRSNGSLPVPPHLKNAPTKLMKQLGHGREYRYPHDEPEAYAAGERYFPDEMEVKRYYSPSSRGLEQKIEEKLARLRALDRRERGEDEPSES
ncbi:MAG: replication-associated recombination protein A [Gammaproteobacteria bacterium]|nr:replication-associated recombination protein A [Gammaproteobacteria bacterium]